MVIIAKQMLPAPPPPPLPRPVRQPRVSRFSCAVMSAPPDGYVLPSSSDTSENEEEEEEEEMSSDHSVPEYEDDQYSTHSTPQRRSTSAQLDIEYVPRRLTHPARRPAQAPSPMRRASLPERTSPVAKRSPQSIRNKLRSPQTGSRKRKQRSPQQIVSAAFTTEPVSPLQPDKVSRSSTSPQDTAQSKNPDEHDETFNLLQVNVGHHTFNSIPKRIKSLLSTAVLP
jgi:hypothetical protein